MTERSCRRVAVLSLAALLGTVAPRSAAAADPRKEAGAAMIEGNAALAAGDLAAAIAAYARARELLPAATGPLVALGLAYEMNGACEDALPLLEEYLDRKGDAGRPEAREALARCRAASPPPEEPEPSPEGPPPREPTAPEPVPGKRVDPVLIAGTGVGVVGVVGVVIGVVFSARFHSARSAFVGATAGYRPDPDGPIVAELPVGESGPVDLCSESGRAMLTNADRTALAEAIELCDRMRSSRAVGWGIGIAGGVLTAAGVALAVWSGTKSRPSGSPAVSILPTRRGLYATVRWSF